MADKLSVIDLIPKVVQRHLLLVCGDGVAVITGPRHRLLCLGLSLIRPFQASDTDPTQARRPIRHLLLPGAGGHVSPGRGHVASTAEPCFESPRFKGT